MVDELTWKKEKPWGTGYYWFRRASAPDEYSICYVRDGEPLMAAYCCDILEPADLFTFSDGEWLGPIRPVAA